jgi:succinoglycan biosynthesis transport protein ExoP
VNQGDFQDRRSHLLRDSLRYHFLLVALFIVAGAVAGVGLALARPATYSSSTTLLVTQIPGNPYGPTLTSSNSDTLEMLQTEAVAVTSQHVLKHVVSALALTVTPDKLRSQTVVVVPPNTQALQITYTGSDRAQAPRVVNSIAQQYLGVRLHQAHTAVRSQIRTIAGELRSARTALVKATARHDPSVATLRASVIDLQGRMATLTAQATSPGRVLTQGTTPSGSETRHRVIYGVAGLAVGLLLGIGAAVWRERRTDLIRSPLDLQDYELPAPVSTVPGASLDDTAMRQLRMRLSAHTRSHETVGLVGLASGQSLRFGVMLARSLAAGGKSVVLVDGTGTDPRHDDVLGAGAEPGLSEALLNDKVPTTLAVDSDFDYVPAGRSPQESSEYFVEERTAKILHSISENHDLTLIACMPPDTIEGEALARLSGSVLLLVQLNKTSHFDLGSALRSFSSQGLRLGGVFVLPRRL